MNILLTARDNRGIRQADQSFESFGIYVALVGARFEMLSEMESTFCLNLESQIPVPL